VSTRQLVEQLLVEGVGLLAIPRRHEDVAADELVNNLAVGGHTAEGDVHVAVKLDGHLERRRGTWRIFNLFNFSHHFGSN